ncbi:nucleopolyhedrovirus P10 family protein [Streptomyces sp. HMX87]|uniref:nucleopolyhedrovirus P10 family protein n=1 Tax=Streptomyces sp. HMX87 TaxID=3390849 RepID=UPI003A868C50
MTTADRWTQAVREQLGLGRFLPLGGPRDGAWIAERAAREVLLGAVRDVAGVRVDGLRIALADPREAHDPVVPPPPSALAPGSLRMTAEVAATMSEPLPSTTARLRIALAGAASARLGLTVTDVDLRVTTLLDSEPTPAGRPEPGHAPERGDRGTGHDGDTGHDDMGHDGEGDAGRAAGAALAVPGVTRLTGALGRAVTIEERSDGTALPHRHVRLECAVGRDHRAVEVARRVRTAVRDALPDHPSVAVLVTAVD